MDEPTCPPSSALTCRSDSVLCLFRGKVRKTLQTPHPQSKKMRLTRLKPVLGENLEDLHCELECQRSAEKPTTTRNWIVDDLLGTLLLEQGRRQYGRHFHQFVSPSADHADHSPPITAGCSLLRTWARRQPTPQASACQRASRCPPAVPPSATQERRDSARGD